MYMSTLCAKYHYFIILLILQIRQQGPSKCKSLDQYGMAASWWSWVEIQVSHLLYN